MRRLTLGGCQLNAVFLANVMADLVEKVVWVSDGGILEEKLSDKIKFNKYNIVRTRHPSSSVLSFLNKTIKADDISHVLVFDPVLSIEAFSLRYINGCEVYSYITAQSTPLFYFPQSFPTFFVNHDTLGRYRQKFGKSKVRHVIRNRIDLNLYCAKLFQAEELIPLYGENEQSEKLHLLVTRVSTDKKQTIIYFCKFAEYYTKIHTNSHFYIAGGGNFSDDLKEIIVENNYPVKTLGSIQSIIPYLQSANFVYGMASSIQQALSCGTKSIVLGDLGFASLVTEKNVDTFDKFHFNLHTKKATPFETLRIQIEASSDNSAWERQYALENYDIIKGCDYILKKFQDSEYSQSLYELVRSFMSFYFIKIIRRIS